MKFVPLKGSKTRSDKFLGNVYIGRKEGRKEGGSEGREVGRKEGRKEGRKKGWKEGSSNL